MAVNGIIGDLKLPKLLHHLPSILHSCCDVQKPYGINHSYYINQR